MAGFGDTNETREGGTGECDGGGRGGEESEKREGAGEVGGDGEVG